MFLENKDRIIQEKLIAASKKPLFLVLFTLDHYHYKTTTKLRKSLRGILNCCKLQIVFKAQNKLANAFSYKDCISKELISVAVYKFQCGLCNKSYYGGYVRNLM